jgi:hypothetical protein
MKTTYDTVKFITENKGLVLLGVIGVVLVFVWSADYNESVNANY